MLLTPPHSPHLTTSLAPEDRLGLVLDGRLELVSILGIGAFGIVYQAVDILTNTPYAVKVLPKAGLDSRQRRIQRREIALHYQASQHPNVVSLYRVIDAPDCTFVVLEYCPEGDLFSQITERGAYIGDEYAAKRAFLQILDAVIHCHSLGIYHRDLKPENILVADDGRTLRIADFGLATNDYYSVDHGCGSTFYMSPECGQDRPYGRYATAPNDVWSLGVVLVNLCAGRNPWKRASTEDSTFRAFLKDPEFLSTILPISSQLNDILRKVFECDPRRRITLMELRELVIACPRLTTSGYADLPPSPPASAYSPCSDASECATTALPPSPPQSPGPYITNQPQESQWSLFDPNSKQSSTLSSSSTDSGYESETGCLDSGHHVPQVYNFYGNMIPFYGQDKVYFQQDTFVPPAVTAF